MMLGISYAFWTFSQNQEELNVIGTNCLKLELKNESEGITVSEGYPLSESEGLKTKPYTFMIKNTCESIVDYSINLESLALDDIEETKIMKAQYIKVAIDEEVGNLNRDFTKIEDRNKYYNEEAIESRTLINGYLNRKEEKEYNLRIWIDEETAKDEESMGKTFTSKIVIEGKENTIIAQVPNINTRNLDYEGNEVDLTQTNNYTYESNITITNHNPKEELYIKTNKDIEVEGNIIGTCGTEDKPDTCTVEEITSLTPNTWYKITNNTKLKPKSNETEEIEIRVISCVDKECSGIGTGVLHKEDKTGPEISIGTIEKDENQITIPYTVSDTESGIKNTICKYGTSETNLSEEGTIENNRCKLENLNSNTTYYYKIESKNKLNQETKTTGTINTDEVLTSPQIEVDNNTYANSHTVSIKTVGSADSGIVNYEYYITTDEEETPTSSTIATGTTNNQITLTNTNYEGLIYVYYRTVSTKGNKSSWSGVEEVKLYYKAESIEYSGITIPNANTIKDAMDKIKGI